MKFYMTPGTCSTGIHILLEELGQIFEVYVVNLLAGDQDKPDFRAINPKGTIPTLVCPDGTVLTEFQAIAWWLASQDEKANLLPEGLAEQTKVIEVMSYAVDTIHMQGFTRIFTTDKFTPNEADYDWVKKQGLDIVNRGLTIVNDLLSEQGYVLDTFSIADIALFYVEFWADKTNITLPNDCHQHYQTMLKRPIVRQVLMEEGYNVA